MGRNKWSITSNEVNEIDEVNQIRFKTSILRTSLCDYKDAYIFIKGTITVAQETAAAQNNANKKGNI